MSDKLEFKYRPLEPEFTKHPLFPTRDDLIAVKEIITKQASDSLKYIDSYKNSLTELYNFCSENIDMGTDACWWDYDQIKGQRNRLDKMQRNIPDSLPLDEQIKLWSKEFSEISDPSYYIFDSLENIRNNAHLSTGSYEALNEHLDKVDDEANRLLNLVTIGDLDYDLKEFAEGEERLEQLKAKQEYSPYTELMGYVDFRDIPVVTAGAFKALSEHHPYDFLVRVAKTQNEIAFDQNGIHDSGYWIGDSSGLEEAFVNWDETDPEHYLVDVSDSVLERLEKRIQDKNLTETLDGLDSLDNLEVDQITL